MTHDIIFYLFCRISYNYCLMMHPMGVLVNTISALSVFHPDANPALKIKKASINLLSFELFLHHANILVIAYNRTLCILNLLIHAFGFSYFLITLYNVHGEVLFFLQKIEHVLFIIVVLFSWFSFDFLSSNISYNLMQEGLDIYNSKEVRDKQIARIIGKV